LLVEVRTTHREAEKGMARENDQKESQDEEEKGKGTEAATLEGGRHQAGKTPL
jgi:hypothetical protein